MSKNHQIWHKELVKFWVEKYGYSKEYCDAIAIIKRNYYTKDVAKVPFR